MSGTIGADGISAGVAVASSSFDKISISAPTSGSVSKWSLPNGKLSGTKIGAGGRPLAVGAVARLGYVKSTPWPMDSTCWKL